MMQMVKSSVQFSKFCNVDFFTFLDTHESLAPTHVCLSVGPLVILSNFQSVSSLVALREKLKREDLNYFCVFSESVFSESVFS